MASMSDEHMEPFQVDETTVICPACGEKVTVPVVVDTAGYYDEGPFVIYLHVKFRDQEISHRCRGRQA